MPKNAGRTRPNPKSSQKWEPPPNDKTPLFVHGALDDYGLDLYEFRVLAHVVRREGKIRGCDEAQGNMARICGMSQRKVLEVLRVLCDAGIIRKENTKGKRTNTYRLNEGSQWKPPSELEKIRNKGKEKLLADQIEFTEHCADTFYSEAQVALTEGNTAGARIYGQQSLTIFESINHCKAAEVKQWLSSNG
jgi:DNA-binding MarR family transcriptional regulator